MKAIQRVFSLFFASMMLLLPLSFSTYAQVLQEESPVLSPSFSEAGAVSSILKPNDDTLSCGDTVDFVYTVTSDYSTYALGIDFLKSWDEGVFEVVSAEWLLSGGFLVNVDLDHGSAVFAAISSVSAKGDIFKITLRVRDNAPVGETQVSLSIFESGKALSTSSAVVSVLDRSAVVDKPELKSVTTTSVTLVAQDGMEYSMDGKTWQASPVFEGLDDGTEYTFYQRLSKTATQSASSASEALKVVTLGIPKDMVGDLNVDGTVSQEDAFYLLYHVLFSKYYSVSQPVDFDGDGAVSISDAV